MSFQETTAANIRNLFADLQENAANKKIVEIQDDLKVLKSKVEGSKIFDAKDKAMPSFGAAALGFIKMKVRRNLNNAPEGASLDVQAVERWAMPLRPLTSEERVGALMSDTGDMLFPGGIAAGGALGMGEGLPELVKNVSRFAVSDTLSTLCGIGLVGGMIYWGTGKAYRSALRLRASFSDKTLVAVLPDALTDAEPGHMTGAGMQANLMKVQLGRTSVPMPKAA